MWFAHTYCTKFDSYVEQDWTMRFKIMAFGKWKCRCNSGMNFLKPLKLQPFYALPCNLLAWIHVILAWSTTVRIIIHLPLFEPKPLMGVEQLIMDLRMTCRRMRCAWKRLDHLLLLEKTTQTIQTQNFYFILNVKHLHTMDNVMVVVVVMRLLPCRSPPF